jgi:methionyl-tRNA formyltransferase
MPGMSVPMRVVLFGSPAFALPTLRGLIEAPSVEVVCAVTQPPRPRGRSGRPHPTEVAAAAEEAGIATLTPERLRRDATEQIEALRPDVGVLAASGHLLPTHLLEAFPHGVVNVHASLLPRHRGASPVAAAILAGDAEAGASLMRIVRELDAGPVIAAARTPIDPLDTTATLTARIADLGAALLLARLPAWVAGELTATPQDEAAASYAPRLTRADGTIDWSLPAIELWRRVRAYQPWPPASTTYPTRAPTAIERDEPFLVHEAWPAPLPEEARTAPPGTVCAGGGEQLTPLLPGRVARAVVVTGEGGLALLRVQRAGRRASAIEDYLRGDRELIGARLGGGAAP